jgi:hypothetical protein
MSRTEKDIVDHLEHSSIDAIDGDVQPTKKEFGGVSAVLAGEVHNMNLEDRATA